MRCLRPCQKIRQLSLNVNNQSNTEENNMLNEVQRDIRDQEAADATTRAVSLKTARDEVTGIETEMATATQTMDGYRGVIVKAKQELEMLGSTEDLTTELRKRQIDLEDTIKHNELFITGVEKHTPNLNHRLRMAKIGVDDAHQTIADHRATELSEGPPPHERAKLMSKPRSKLSFQEKDAIVEKYGMDFFKTIPLI